MDDEMNRDEKIEYLVEQIADPKTPEIWRALYQLALQKLIAE